MKAEDPYLVPIAGGTDLMVAGSRRPAGLLDLTGIGELRDWALYGTGSGRFLRLGAGLTYARIIDELGEYAPALAMAARTVGSPQIRNRGTLGGNLGTASPAADGLPPVLALGGSVELVSASGSRTVPVDEFCTAAKRTVRGSGELIAAIHLPAARGPQQFAKVGPRNAMVIAIASIATVLDPANGSVGVGIGAAAPTPVRAPRAEEFASSALDWHARTPIAPEVVWRFGRFVADGCAPIDDVRSTAAYRTHAVTVLAGRSLRWAWDDYLGSGR